MSVKGIFGWEKACERPRERSDIGMVISAAFLIKMCNFDGICTGPINFFWILGVILGGLFFFLCRQNEYFIYINKEKCSIITRLFLAKLDCYWGRGVKEKELFFHMTGIIIIVTFPIGSGLKILSQEMIKTVLWSLQGWVVSQIYFKISLLNDFLALFDLCLGWESSKWYVVQLLFSNNTYGY